MGKSGVGFICIAHWQHETVRHKDRVFTFSPFGLGQIDGWVLMAWQRMAACSLGHRHDIDSWFNQSTLIGRKDNDKPPLVPRSVWRELSRKTKNVKKAPWPGSD